MGKREGADKRRGESCPTCRRPEGRRITLLRWWFQEEYGVGCSRVCSICPSRWFLPLGIVPRYLINWGLQLFPSGGCRTRPGHKLLGTAITI